LVIADSGGSSSRCNRRYYPYTAQESRVVQYLLRYTKGILYNAVSMKRILRYGNNRSGEHYAHRPRYMVDRFNPRRGNPFVF